MSTEGQAQARARPSVDMNWPWSDLLTDVVLTSVGGLGNEGRSEGVVWVGELLCPSVVASSGSKSSKTEGLGFFEPLWPTVVASSGSKFTKPLGRTHVDSSGSKS